MHGDRKAGYSAEHTGGNRPMLKLVGRALVFGLVLALLMFAVPSPGLQAQAVPPPYQWRGTGDGAIASFWIGPWMEEGSIVGGLILTRGVYSDGTRIYYSVAVIRQGQFETFEQGVGTIPATDVTGSTEGILTLNTNTQTVPGFWHDYGAGGRIFLRWRATWSSGMYSYQTVGSYRIFQPDGSIYSVSGRRSATDQTPVEGSVFGFNLLPYPAAWGYVEKFSDAVIVITPPGRQ